MIDENHVSSIRDSFQALLGRDPEPAAIEHFSGVPLKDLLHNILGSVEFSQKNRGSPFWHYASTPIDLQAIIEKHALLDVSTTPGHLTNFLGVALELESVPALKGYSAGVEAAPLPANWHADIAEWGAALRAVDLARNNFKMIELGCGWGCWMNNTGVAAKRKGLNITLIGVEADKTHHNIASKTLKKNGIKETEYELYLGVASAKDGFALFPTEDAGGLNWGLKPIFDSTDKERKILLQGGSYKESPMISLGGICKKYEKIDLLHVDIQGGEVDLVSGCSELLNRKFSYLVIGTHSRSIEGQLIDMLQKMGWILEIERPALMVISETAIDIMVDGVQGWRNPRWSSGIS